MNEDKKLPPAFDYAASKQMAVTREWCRGWDDCRSALAASGVAAPVLDLGVLGNSIYRGAVRDCITRVEATHMIEGEKPLMYREAILGRLEDMTVETFAPHIPALRGMPATVAHPRGVDFGDDSYRRSTPSQPVAAEAPAEVALHAAMKCLQAGGSIEPDSHLHWVISEAVRGLAAPVEVQGAHTFPKTCPNCDDTGDVHSVTGEWRGRCYCPAGVPSALAGRPAPAATWECPECHTGGCEIGKCHIGAKPPAPAAEAVYQLRAPLSQDWIDTPKPEYMQAETHGKWYEVSEEVYANFSTDPSYKARTLYTRPAAPLSEVTDAQRDVLAERQRQMAVEGWTPEHDDETYSTEELAFAAVCYATADEGDAPPAVWPWPWAWWKPKDRRRNLVKAGALILAEIERLDRAALRPTPSNERG
jgi:hypothetical protein